MRLLVIAEKIHMHDGQTTCHVDLRTDSGQFAQQDRDDHSRRNKLQLLDQVVAGNEATQAIDDRQDRLKREKNYRARETVSIAEDQQENHQRIGFTQGWGPTPPGGGKKGTPPPPRGG